MNHSATSVSHLVWRRSVRRFFTLAIGLLVAPTLSVAQIPPPQEPVVAEASLEGERAIAGFSKPAEMNIRLFAAEPDVANPVAFTVDGQGRVWVAESFRQNRGVTDNRQHDQTWLNADLAAETVEDRIAYHKRLLGEKVVEYTQQDDRIRLLEDLDQDGQVDRSTVFAKHFNNIEDGTGAGLLVDGQNVYYTCIPHLWLLTDQNGDRVADQRTPLHSGYGVRVAFRGHDLHGLCIGPDGRLYFSIGDRGYHITLWDGRNLSDPASGAVFRCETDGSNLEVFATGLRNPQELAFDNYGNLFTGDNNSDSGDRARWVYVVEGGDTGWRMYYQYLPDRGPFNREKIWHPYHEGQPAYIVPPVANFADGPSGLLFYSGVGLPESFRDRFLLCDFRGGPANSGIRSFRVQPAGAFFTMSDEEQPFWKILATDVEQAPDGGVYVSDWVNGWNGEGKGRIYKFYDPELTGDALVREVAEILADTQLAQRPNSALAKLLDHPDRRVRQRAQRTLADKSARAELAGASQSAATEFGRLHAIWGLGQLARRGDAAALQSLVGLLADSDAEVQAQTLKTLGDSSQALTRDQLQTTMLPLVASDSPRVAYFASQLIGKAHYSPGVPALLDTLRENQDRDPIIRHGAIMGLANGATDKQLAAAAGDTSRFVRKGVLVAMRKRGLGQVSLFLNDSEPELVVEAARAIHDAPALSQQLPALAELINRVPSDDALARRVLNANFQLGGKQRAEALAAYAASATAPESLRIEALQMLSQWAKPSPRDRVLGRWNLLPNRDRAVASAALRAQLAGVVSAPPKVRDVAINVATALGIQEVVPSLRTMLAKGDGSEQAAALIALGALNADDLVSLAKQRLTHPEPAVRIAARRVLVSRSPEAVAESLAAAMQSEDQRELQQAFALLGEVNEDQLLLDAVRRLRGGSLPATVRLEVLEAAGKSKSANVKQELQAYTASRDASDTATVRYAESLAGGDARRGEKIFFERTQVSCVRCHRAAGRGGDVGPVLSAIGKEKDRNYLLEAIVVPNKAMAKGFKSVVIADIDGQVHSGIVREETADAYVLVNAEGAKKRILKDDVDEISDGKSPMPEDLIKHLSRRDLRDLVEYLASLQTPEDATKHE